MESGLRLEWYNEGVKDWHLCRDMQRSGASKAGVLSFDELSYDDMAAIFVLWGIMTTFSLVVFLTEILLKSRKRNSVFMRRGVRNFGNFKRNLAFGRHASCK
ncbi:hypothetical protein MTO96_025406 [Rhipicephalus appendiculatus]